MKLRITKEEFMEVISRLEKQDEKDNEFCDFMEKYLDGRFVPQMSTDAHTAALMALSLACGEKLSAGKNGDMTWCEWFCYECNFGRNVMSAYLCKKEYVIRSASDMYDFLVLLNGRKK